METFNNIIKGLLDVNASGGIKVTTVSKLDNQVYIKLGAAILIAVVVAVIMSAMIRSMFSK